MSFLSCNVKGINNFNKDAIIREMISKRRIEILGLTETKLLHVNSQRINSIWGNNPFAYLVANAASNCSGGVILIWNPDFFILKTSFIGERWIIAEGILSPFGWDCSIRIIYGGHIVADQSQIYAEIDQIKNFLTSPHLPTPSLCDFNQILLVSERKNQVYDI